MASRMRSTERPSSASNCLLITSPRRSRRESVFSRNSGRALDRGRQLLGFSIPVVALHHARGVLADGLQELAPVVLEAVADLPDQALVVARLAAALDVLDNGAPLLEVPIDHPVDELVYALVYEVLGIGDDLPLEALLHLLLAHKLAKVHQPYVLLQPRVAPLVERVDDVLDLR